MRKSIHNSDIFRIFYALSFFFSSSDIKQKRVFMFHWLPGILSLFHELGRREKKYGIK